MNSGQRNLLWLKRIIWISFTLFWTSFVTLFFIGKSMLPSFRALDDKKPMEASIVYSEDGVILGKYFDQNRVPVTYEEISPYVITALLATEDITFYEHSGISLRGLPKSLAQQYTRRKQARGKYYHYAISQKFIRRRSRTRTQH